MTDTFNIINSSKNLALTSASALSRLRWLDLARDGTDTFTFTLNIEAHIWLARWQRESGTFRRPPVVALNLTRSKNLIHGDFRKLADDEVDNAVDLIKDIFAEQIVVPACKKAFNKDWKHLPNVSSSNARCGWIIEENNMFQQGSLQASGPLTQRLLLSTGLSLHLPSPPSKLIMHRDLVTNPLSLHLPSPPSKLIVHHDLVTNPLSSLNTPTV
ncbi:hypothetical protein P692DRAFT_20816526 [Suillus brevipes Sb2]|nr:hypothetical protein P692DRAFT_20816526 [Suillus brevipes Sb2]